MEIDRNSYKYLVTSHIISPNHWVMQEVYFHNDGVPFLSEYSPDTPYLPGNESIKTNMKVAS